MSDKTGCTCIVDWLILGAITLSVMFWESIAMTIVHSAMMGLYTSAIRDANAADMEGPTTGMMFNTPERTPMAPAYGWPTIVNPTKARKPWMTELMTVERR